jgi:hypothetical protein
LKIPEIPKTLDIFLQILKTPDIFSKFVKLLKIHAKSKNSFTLLKFQKPGADWVQKASAAIGFI